MVHGRRSWDGGVMSNIPMGVLSTLDVGYRYLRMDVTNNGGNAQTYWAGLEFLVGTDIYPPDMTSDTAPSPNVASGVSLETAGTNWYSFDRDNATQWVSVNGSTAQVTIDLGAGNKINPTSAKLTSGTSAVNGAPADFTFRGSNNAFASEDVTLYTATGITFTATGETQTYTF